MNTYARKIALESGTIRMSEIAPGDTIFCRLESNDYQYEPSRVVSVENLFSGRVVQITHESGDVTEHDYKAYAKLA